VGNLKIDVISNESFAFHTLFVFMPEEYKKCPNLFTYDENFRYRAYDSKCETLWHSHWFGSGKIVTTDGKNGSLK
jgi:hypothetical protein